MALLVVTVTIALIGAVVGEFAYNARVDMEAAANSRDLLRAEYLARSAMQLGRMLIMVQGNIQKMMQALGPQAQGFADLIVITDYADFLAKAFGGDAEARAGLGGLVGLDLGNAEGLGSGKGTNLDLTVTSEEGKYMLNCGGGQNPTAQTRTSLFRLLDSMIRPPRYNRMFNIPDRDNVMITYEDLPRAIMDWMDIDQQRFEPGGNATAAEERYDKGRDRYEAHNNYLDTIEELTLVRGVSEDFFGAFGGMFTVYGTSDCKVLANAVPAESWPLLAAMIAASSPDATAAFDPNTALVAQQVSGMLKILPTLLGGLGKDVIPACNVSAQQCLLPGQPPPPPPPPPRIVNGKPVPQPNQPNQPNAGDNVEKLANFICSPLMANPGLLQQAGQYAQMAGGTLPPTPLTPLKPIKMCPGRLSQYLKYGGGAPNTRRFFRIEARGTVQRTAIKSTQIHISAVWDDKAVVGNPLCSNHPSCTNGTWVYWRMD